MKAVVTVIGQDRVGIISEVSTILAKNSVNILDVSQTILGTNFTMMMHVDIQNDKKIQNLIELFTKQEQVLNLKIKLYNEELFNSMHSL